MKAIMKKLVDLKSQYQSEKMRMDNSTDPAEIRSIGETLLKLKDEIAEAEKELEEKTKNEEPAPAENSNEPTTDERSMNPMASYGLKGAIVERNTDPLATMEYREAFKDYTITGKKSDILQYRADDQNESTDLGVLMPTTVVNEIMKGVEKVHGQLYSRVKKLNVKGGVKFPIGSFGATFNRIGENGAPTDRQNGGSVTGYVEFSTKIGEIRLAQTLLANVLSVPVFESELAKVIVEAYVEAMDNEILNGVDANNQCEGILTELAKTSSRIPATNVITFTDAEMLDWKSWQTKLFAKIPLSMRKDNPEFVMTANTYEANIKTLADDNNRPVYNETFNPVDGTEKATFKGKEVVFVEEGFGIENFGDASNGEVFGLYWIPEKAYAINTNLQFAVKRYFDEEKLQHIDRAVVINDGKILDPKYLYILKKVVSV